jgi:hypothetical protein
MSGAGAACSKESFTPLVSLLRASEPEALREAKRRVGSLDRGNLAARFRIAFAAGKRLVAYILAEALIERAIPPCFWHEELALDSVTLNQRADLLLFDLAWMRRWNREHASVVRYLRGKALLTGSEAVFHREANFAFHEGKRPAWKIVGSLSLTERQQWDCAYLRSAPIKKQADLTRSFGKRIRQTLWNDLQTTRRTATFGEPEAQAALARRHALWCCSRMVKSASPTEIAARFYQMTGVQISRQAAAKQLVKVRAVLRERGDDFMD